MARIARRDDGKIRIALYWIRFFARRLPLLAAALLLWKGIHYLVGWVGVQTIVAVLFAALVSLMVYWRFERRTASSGRVPPGEYRFYWP